MFSIITMASSTTKPVEIVSAISDRLFEAVAEQVHDAERADERERHGDARDDRRAQVAQEHEDDEHDQPDGEQRA